MDTFILNFYYIKVRWSPQTCLLWIFICFNSLLLYDLVKWKIVLVRHTYIYEIRSKFLVAKKYVGRAAQANIWIPVYLSSWPVASYRTLIGQCFSTSADLATRRAAQAQPMCRVSHTSEVFCSCFTSFIRCATAVHVLVINFYIMSARYLLRSL